MTKILDRWFWAFCVAAALAGLLFPGPLRFLAEHIRYLLGSILFVPLGAAFALRPGFPALIEPRRDWWAALSLISLFTLIAGALASVSHDFHDLVREQPRIAAGLLFFMAAVSGLFHLAGYWIAPWRPRADRMALSVNMAYVNNGLAIVFAVEFFKDNPAFGVAAVLPAIFLEIPMALMLVPCKRFMLRKVTKAKQGRGYADDARES